jgi:hypothetical protein
MKTICSLSLVILTFGNILTSAAQNTFFNLYGGTGNEGTTFGRDFTDFTVTPDGGYIHVGTTTTNVTGADVYIVCADSAGNLLWTKSIGPSSSVQYSATAITPAPNNSYVITGYSSTDHVFLWKIDSAGTLIWSKEYLADGYDEKECDVIATSDGGYLLATSRYVTNATDFDGYIIKTNATGNPLWTKRIGGNGSEGFTSAYQTTDGGYILAGNTNSFVLSQSSIFLVKVDATGITEWARAYGGGNYDMGYDVKQCYDGGFIISGYAGSFGGSDACLLKTDSLGNFEWAQAYDAGNVEKAYSVVQTADSGFAVAGCTYVAFSTTNRHILAFKTDAAGYLEWMASYGIGNSGGHTIHQTADKGYVIGGWAAGLGSGGTDLSLIKTDPSGQVGCYHTTISGNEYNFLPIIDTAAVSTAPAVNLSMVNYAVSSSGTMTSQCSGTFAINETSENNIKVYPDPADEFIYIEAGKAHPEFSFILQNCIGKIMDSRKINADENIQLTTQSLPDGIYFASFNTERSVSVIKFIIAHR